MLHSTDSPGDAAANLGEATNSTAAPETTFAVDCATREGNSEPTCNYDARPSDRGGVCDNVPGEASAVAASCFPEPDPLALELCAGAGPLTWVDPMLEELTASLVVSRPAGPTTPRCYTTPAGVSLTMESLRLSPELEPVTETTTDIVVNPPGDVQPSVDNEDSTPPRPAQSRSIVEEIVSRICIPLQTPIIRAGPMLRRSKTPKSGFTMRRSERIAKKPRAANSTLQAQHVLQKKLGVAVDYNVGDDEIVENFRATFAAPLSANKHEALQALFGDDFDPVAMNLDMVGFDAEVL